jgi:hypothetical protein
MPEMKLIHLLTIQRINIARSNLTFIILTFRLLSMYSTKQVNLIQNNNKRD